MASDRRLDRRQRGRGAASRLPNENDANRTPDGPPIETGQEAREIELPAYARNRAARIVRSPEKLREMVDEAREKASTTAPSSSSLAGVIDDLKTMFDLLRAVARGDYRVRTETLVLIAGAVLYFVLPIDIIPDFIPIAGYIDDAAVIAWVVGRCKSEIDLFRSWTMPREDPDPAPTPAPGQTATS